ncbi:MAG TPA: hypothetical protein VH419_09155 [Nocardioidaceae bacterium]|jgi:hypothetical protein
MTTSTMAVHGDIVAALRNELLELAAQQDALADSEAAKVPYWAPCPPHVEGHRVAALALRADADRLIAVSA